jgi:hypothetical protein
LQWRHEGLIGEFVAGAGGAARTLRAILFSPLRGTLLSSHPAGPRGGVSMSRKRPAARHGGRPISAATAGVGVGAARWLLQMWDVGGALCTRSGVRGQELQSRPHTSDPSDGNDPGWTVFHLPSTPGFHPPSSLVIATSEAPRFTSRLGLAGAPEHPGRVHSDDVVPGVLSACRRPHGAESHRNSLAAAGRRPRLPAVVARLFGQARRARGSDAARADGCGCHLA